MYADPLVITDVLAAHVANVRFEDLPAQEITAAEDSLVETMAVAAAAVGAPGVDAALNLARRDRATSKSTVWLTGDPATAARAAFVNSLCAAALDWDSLHHLAVVHSDIVIVPAAAAVAQDQSCDGRELLTAIALGNDMLCRLALATRGEYRGWFFTSVYGVIAAAAVAARLLGGGQREIRNAMGLAFMNSAGTFQALEERSTAKRALAAFASQTGVDCAYLAMAGLDGPQEVVEGRYGLYGVYQRGLAEVITNGLGVRFEGSQISRKPFPTCQCNQAAIEATLAIRHEHSLDVQEVESAEVVLSPYNHRLVGSPFEPARNPQVAAQFSAQYSVACALLHGRLGIPEIQAQCILDPVITELTGRVRLTIDPAVTGTYTPTTVRVLTRDGRRLTARSCVLRGSVDSPLSAGELETKVAQCAEFASPGRDARAAKLALAAARSLRSGAPARDGILQIEKATRRR